MLPVQATTRADVVCTRASGKVSVSEAEVKATAEIGSTSDLTCKRGVYFVLKRRSRADRRSCILSASTVWMRHAQFILARLDLLSYHHRVGTVLLPVSINTAEVCASSAARCPVEARSSNAHVQVTSGPCKRSTACSWPLRLNVHDDATSDQEGHLKTAEAVSKLLVTLAALTTLRLDLNLSAKPRLKSKHEPEPEPPLKREPKSA